MRLVLVLVLASGCVLRDDTVHVTLRDPALVAVHVGDAPILAPAERRGDIPATGAAYLYDPLAGSWVERDGATIEAWCPHCRKWRRRTVVGSTELVLDGTAAEVVRFEGGELHARYLFDDGIPGRRGRLHDAPRIRLELVTPVSNVVAIDHASIVSDRNGGPPDVRHAFERGGIVFGAAYATGGFALGAFGLERASGGAEIAGAAMVLAGTVVIAGCVYLLRARDEHTRVPVP